MSSSSSVHVGLVGGTWLPGNVRTFLTNLQGLLDEHSTTFRLDLLGNDETMSALDGFRVVDPGIRQSDRAIETIRTLGDAVTRYARSTPVDVLFQVTKFPVHGFATSIAGWRTNTPVLARYAGDNFVEHRFAESPSDRVRTFGLNNVLGRIPTHLADAVIVLGPNGRERIESRNPAATVLEIPQPVDTERFSPVSEERKREIRTELGIDVDARVLLTVGRLTKRKGMADVMDAARTLAERNGRAEWYVLGEGPYRSEFSKCPILHAVGRVPHEQIPRYYRAADILVHPSYVEGLPNVLLEAAACELPTLARDVGECAVAASRTFTEDESLAALLEQPYQPVTLDGRFEPARLREAYANAIVRTAER